jgi:hypothetical protein
MQVRFPRGGLHLFSSSFQIDTTLATSVADIGTGVLAPTRAILPQIEARGVDSSCRFCVQADKRRNIMGNDMTFVGWISENYLALVQILPWVMLPVRSWDEVAKY